MLDPGEIYAVLNTSSPEFTCVDDGPAKVAPGFSPANAGPGRPKGLRHITTQVSSGFREEISRAADAVRSATLLE